VARKRGFLMGGFKIPYLNDQPKKLPQPEADSYALSFFEQIFNYSTNQDATEEDFLEAASRAPQTIGPVLIQTISVSVATPSMIFRTVSGVVRRPTLVK